MARWRLSGGIAVDLTLARDEEEEEPMAPWTPAQRPDAVWFDAAVSAARFSSLFAWASRSADTAQLNASNDARPTIETNALNGLPVIRFDGVDDSISGESGIDGATFSVALVVAAAGDAAYVGGGGFALARTGDSAAFTGDGDDVTAGAVADGNAHVLVAVVNGAASLGSVDGDAGDAGDPGTAALGTITVGNGDAMDVAEILVEGVAWDTETRQLVEGYLAHKYALALAEGHPHEDAAPTLPAAAFAKTALERAIGTGFKSGALG